MKEHPILFSFSERIPKWPLQQDMQQLSSSFNVSGTNKWPLQQELAGICRELKFSERILNGHYNFSSVLSNEEPSSVNEPMVTTKTVDSRRTTEDCFSERIPKWPLQPYEQFQFALNYVSVNEFLNGHYNCLRLIQVQTRQSFSERIPKWPLQL